MLAGEELSLQFTVSGRLDGRPAERRDARIASASGGYLVATFPRTRTGRSRAD